MRYPLNAIRFLTYYTLFPFACYQNLRYNLSMRYDLFERFAQSAKRHADIVACQIKEDNAYITYTYGQLYEISLKTASFLSHEGITKHDRVALLLENTPFWPAVYFGILALGATAVPIDPKLTPYEVNNILRDSQAKILFTTNELYLPLKEFLKNILSFRKAALAPFSEITQAKPAAHINTEDKADFIASLLYTSGTTASPKGVMLTHKNFCSNFDSISHLNIIIAKDTVVSLLPLHHSYPFMVTIILPLLLGAKITFLNSLKSEDLLQCLQETKATILVGVPQLYHLLHKAIFEKIKNARFLLGILTVTAIPRKLFHLNVNKLLLRKAHEKFGQALRFFLSGGARLDPTVASELSLLGFTLLEGYGLTETSPVVTFNPPRRIKFGSVGIPVPGVEIKINNPNAEHIGEVLIKGPNVMKGYYKKPKETDEVLKDGWFYSGDLGYRDHNGYLFLTGRSKEVIVLSSGKNIYPEEIETHYLKSPYIKEICVLETVTNGLSSLHAIVVPNTDYFRKTKEVNIQGKVRWLLENLSKELPSYKRIMGFTIAKEELSKTRLGKLKRYEIKPGYLHAAAKEPAESLKPKETITLLTPLESQIIDFLSRELKMKVGINDHLELDLGIDSLNRVALAIGLEKMFAVSLSETDVAEVFTVQELIAKISQHLAQGDGKTSSAIGQPTWSQIMQPTPKQEIIDKIDLFPKRIDTLLTFFILNALLLFLRIFWLLKVEGRNYLPKNKPFIICPNHASFLDGFAIAASVGVRHKLNLFFLGYSGYFQHPIVRWAVKFARLIAIDPAINLTDAMQAASYVLRNNKSLCIFPEGVRSIDETVKDFKKGVGILIQETNCTVVPCYIQGSHQAWSRGKNLPRPYPLKVIFGAPCTKEELKNAGLPYEPHDDYEAITFGLRDKVIALSRVNNGKT